MNRMACLNYFKFKLENKANGANIHEVNNLLHGLEYFIYVHQNNLEFNEDKYEILVTKLKNI